MMEPTAPSKPSRELGLFWGFGSVSFLSLNASIWQVPEQPSPEAALLSSHCSPATTWVVPSPHTASTWHAASQPSPEVVLPSSHCSLARNWRTPSPHAGAETVTSMRYEETAEKVR